MDTRKTSLVDRAKERFSVQDYYSAIHLIEELVDTGNAFADAHHLLGLSYYLAGRSEKALDALDKAIELNPRYVEAHVNRGIVLNDLGRTDEAAVAFASAHATSGDSRMGIPAHSAAKLANLHAELGEAYVDSGALPQAIEQYEVALDLGPEFHDLRYRLGRLLLDSGRSLEAREAFEKVVDARSGFADGRAALGLACYLSGDAASAREVWGALTQENPNDARAKAYLAMLERTSPE